MKKIFIISFLIIQMFAFSIPTLAQNEGECPDLNNPDCFKQSDIQSPSQWLKEIEVPGIPWGGLDLVNCVLIPNSLNMLLLLVIIGSLIMLIVGGITWITSHGDKEGTAKAKATVTYAIIGLFLGLGSFIILNTLFNFLFLEPDSCKNSLLTE